MGGEEPFLLSASSPTRDQKKLAGAVALALLLCFLATLPLIHRQLPRHDAFIPIVDSVIFLNDLIVAVLLYAQYSVARSPSLQRSPASAFDEASKAASRFNNTNNFETEVL